MNVRILGSWDPRIQAKKDSRLFENLYNSESRIQGSKNLGIQGSRNPSKKDSESFENLNKRESRIQESKHPGIQESKQKR